MLNVEFTMQSIAPDMPVLFISVIRAAKVLIHFHERSVSRPPRMLRKFEEAAFGRSCGIQVPFTDELFLECVVADVKHKSIARVIPGILTTAMN